MKNLIFCLVLTMLFSVGIWGQKSVRSKPKKQPTPQQSWKTFFPKFKTAVAERDEITLKGMMPQNVYCDDENQFQDAAWKFCESNASRVDDNRIAVNLIFELLGRNNNQGWQQFKNFLDSGKEMKGTASTYKVIVLDSNPKCGDLHLSFQYQNKRWLFTGFGTQGCRD